MVPYIRAETMAFQASTVIGPKAATERQTRRTWSSVNDLWLPCPTWLKRTATLLHSVNGMLENEQIIFLVVEVRSGLGGQPKALIHNKDMLQVCVMFNFQDTTVLAAGQDNTLTLSRSFVLKDAD